MSEQIYSHEELFAIVSSLLEKYHARKAILFGSYARREANSHSDIDLIIVGGDSFDPTDVFALAEDLHRTTGKEVDVYELSEINAGTDFYKTILSEGVQIA